MGAEAGRWSRNGAWARNTYLGLIRGDEEEEMFYLTLSLRGLFAFGCNVEDIFDLCC